MKNKFKMNLQLFGSKNSVKRYYSLYQDTKNQTADIYIYGDITSWPWDETDVSSYTLSKELQELGDEIENINVYINSYGGEVAEGLAIYNALKRHRAKVTTYADGFACSIASVIFAAGDERIMSNTSLLMIHNAWTWAAGNANDLKKQAEDLEKITQASINAYMNIVNIKEEEIKEMMDNESWLDAHEALEMGFATKLVETEEKEVATQSVKNKIFQMIMDDDDDTDDTEDTDDIDDTEDTEDIEEVADYIAETVVKKLKEEFDDEDGEDNEDDEDNDTGENEPLNMMKALFNVKK